MIRRVASAVFGVCVGIAALSGQTTSAQGTCDKACLTDIATRYFAAIAAHDPSKAPMAPNAKFTEQTKVLDMAPVQILKVRDRKIHEIEATGVVLPFMSPSGWSEFLR